jgi:hypothetical protein
MPPLCFSLNQQSFQQLLLEVMDAEVMIGDEGSRQQGGGSGPCGDTEFLH